MLDWRINREKIAMLPIYAMVFLMPINQKLCTLFILFNVILSVLNFRENIYTFIRNYGLLFILYTTPLSQIIKKYEDLQHHFYADDTQIYTSFNASNHNSKIQSLQDCLMSVQDWMFTNKLKLNPDKTEFMLVGNKCQRKKIDC